MNRNLTLSVAIIFADLNVITISQNRREGVALNLGSSHLKLGSFASHHICVTNLYKSKIPLIKANLHEKRI